MYRECVTWDEERIREAALDVWGGGGAQRPFGVLMSLLKTGANSAVKIYTIVIIREVLKTHYLCVIICLMYL
jgi:hypothetical protein